MNELQDCPPRTKTLSTQRSTHPTPVNGLQDRGTSISPAWSLVPCIRPDVHCSARPRACHGLPTLTFVLTAVVHCPSHGAFLPQSFARRLPEALQDPARAAASEVCGRCAGFHLQGELDLQFSIRRRASPIQRCGSAHGRGTITSSVWREAMHLDHLYLLSYLVRCRKLLCPPLSSSSIDHLSHLSRSQLPTPPPTIFFRSPGLILLPVVSFCLNPSNSRVPLPVTKHRKDFGVEFLACRAPEHQRCTIAKYGSSKVIGVL